MCRPRRCQLRCGRSWRGHFPSFPPARQRTERNPADARALGAGFPLCAPLGGNDARVAATRRLHRGRPLRYCSASAGIADRWKSHPVNRSSSPSRWIGFVGRHVVRALARRRTGCASPCADRTSPATCSLWARWPDSRGADQSALPDSVAARCATPTRGQSGRHPVRTGGRLSTPSTAGAAPWQLRARPGVKPGARVGDRRRRTLARSLRAL